MQMRFAAVAAAGGIVLSGLLAGCTSDADEVPKLSGTQEYSSVEDVGADLRARGVDCTPELDSGVKWATQAGRCDLDGQETIIGILTNDSQLSEYKSSTNFVATTLQEPSYLVIGKNWVVSCSSNEDCANTISGALGGQIWESQS